MKIAIQTDAYPEIGTGHLMRCFTLAEGLNDNGHEFFFVTYCESNTLFERLKKENFVLYLLKTPTSLEESKEIFKKESPEWVVLDGYHFSPEYQRAIKDSGYKILVIDDYAHLEHYYADIILNQNYGAEKFSYNAEPHTRFLLGTKYVLLRREFLQHSNYKRQIPVMAQKVLITMGGGDPENNTLKVLRAVNLIETPLDVRVIIGVSNPHYAPIKKKADESRHNIEILRDVKGMAPLMAWADVAVSAGGTTTWELAFMGLPSLLCIVAGNQEYAVSSLSRDGVFQSIGWVRDRTNKEISDRLVDFIYDKDLRNVMHKKCNTIVDGRGTYRIVKELRA